MNLANMWWTTSHKGPLAALSAGVLALGGMVPLASSVSAAPGKSLTITYPSSSGAAAAQAGEWFDIDAEVSHGGTVRAAIRAFPPGHGEEPGQWIPLEVATERPVRAVNEGSVTMMANAPLGTKPGNYTLRVQLVDDSGKAIGKDRTRVRGGVTIERYGLTTGFESNEGKTWTSFEQEQSFLTRLAERSPRTALTELGQAVNGLPYNPLTIGAPEPKSLEEIEGNAVLLVCSQHGDEPSGREACLQRARRLAFTDDARVREYLSENNVLVIPSANPDGSMANTRENANNADLNRDHLRLEQPEARMMAKVMRDAHPETVHDLHDFGGGDDRPELLVIWGRHLGIDEEIRDYGSSWGDNWVRPRAEAAGYTTGPYIANPGTGENVTLTNGAMLRNLNGVISETNASVLGGETRHSSQLRRVATQRLAIHQTLRQHRVLQHEMSKSFQDANQRNVQMGYTQERPYYFTGNSESPDPPPPDAFIMDVPCGYLLTQEQAKDRETWMRLFDVTAQDVSFGPETFVPMWQASSAVIPLMFDARAAGSNEIEATPVADCSTVEQSSVSNGSPQSYTLSSSRLFAPIRLPWRLI